MATHHDKITPEQQALIAQSRVFFVASAHARLEAGPSGQGGVNLAFRATDIITAALAPVAQLDRAAVF